MNHPNPHPPMKAMNVRLFGARNAMAKMMATAIIRAPQIACEMWSVPFPSCGYPVMIRNTRFPITDPTAQTRNRSSRRPTSALRNAKRGTCGRRTSIIAAVCQGRERTMRYAARLRRW